MKKLYTLLMAGMVLGTTVSAQTVISNGFPGMGIVNGNTYTRTNTVGSINFMFVSGGFGPNAYASAQNGKLYFINTSTEMIVDSMNLNTRDLEDAGGSMLLAARGNYIYWINTGNKTVVDSIDIGTMPERIELHPNTNELWVSADSMVHVVTYTSILSKTSFQAGHDTYDYGDIRFTKGGSVAYKGSQANATVYKIDAVNKTVLDSIQLNSNISGLTVSSDSSKLFVSSSNAMKIYVYETANLGLVDSITTTREPFGLYTHPTRAELWCVDHFDDSLTVFDEGNYSIVAAFDLPSGPHNISFLKNSIGINDVTAAMNNITVYPNPASDVVTLTLPEGQKELKLYNNFGSLINTYTTTSSTYNMDIAALPAGVYHVILDQNGSKGHARFVKY